MAATPTTGFLVIADLTEYTAVELVPRILNGRHAIVAMRDAPDGKQE